MTIEASPMKTNTKKGTKILGRHRRKETNLIAVLQDIKEACNWLPPEALKMVSSVNWFGACAPAPIVIVDGTYHGQTTVKKVKPTLDTYLREKRKTKKAAQKK